MPKQTPVKTVSELVEEYKALSGGDRQETQWLYTALTSLLEGVVARQEQILADEIAQAHKEGTPTARLTSAYMRLKDIIHEVMK